MKFPFNWYNKFGTIPSSYREAMSYEEQIIWLCQQVENLKTGTANYNYNLLENKPSINGVVLQGNVTTTQLGIDYNYNSLLNKPSINGITLLGNKTLSDLEIQGKLTAGSGIRIVGNTISATGGGSGSGSYIDLSDKPAINGVTLLGGDNTPEELGLQKSLDYEFVISDFGETLDLNGYQLHDIIPEQLSGIIQSNTGNLVLKNVPQTTELRIYGNFDYFVIDEDNYLQEIFTTQNRVTEKVHTADFNQKIIINFFDLNTYDYYVRKYYNGFNLNQEIQEVDKQREKNTYDLYSLILNNSTETTISNYTSGYFNINQQSAGSMLPEKTTDSNSKYVKLDLAENYITTMILKGKALGVPMWFTTKLVDGIEYVMTTSNLNIIYQNNNTSRLFIPEEAKYLYIQFTNINDLAPQAIVTKITSGNAGVNVTKLSSNLILQASTPLTLTTGFYQTVSDLNNNFGVYYHSATAQNLILGGNELFYFDSPSQTLIFENKNYFYDESEADWGIQEHTNITNEIVNDRSKIPTSQAVYNALQNTGLFYSALQNDITFNLDGTISDSNGTLTLTDGFYLTKLVYYTDDNGSHLASLLSQNFCYYNSSSNIFLLTGLQRGGLLNYNTFLSYLNSTSGWLYFEKSFTNVLDTSKIATSISSTSTDSEVASAKAVYDNSLDVFSTTEQKIGTWLNGKPLYKITLETSSIPQVATDGSSTFETYNFASNVDFAFIFNSFAINNDESTIQSLPYINNAGYQLKSQLTIENDFRKLVFISNGTAYNNYSKLVATIFYTKSTD